AIHKPADTKILAYLAISVEANFGERSKDFGLVLAPTVEEAVSGGDAIVIVSRRPGAVANEAFAKIALERAPDGASIFVHGALANSLAVARDFAAVAASRRQALRGGCLRWNCRRTLR